MHLFIWQKNGVEILYYENGNLSRELHYSNDSITDTVRKEYYENGNLKYICRYSQSGKDGKENFYYENGQPIRSINYSNGRILDTLVKDFYKNGKLKMIRNYVDPNATAKYFDTNGNPIIIPGFIIANHEWHIKNSADSSDILTLDTIKLSTSLGRNEMNFAEDSPRFSFDAWSVDTLTDEAGNPKPVGTLMEFKTGKWFYDKVTAALNLYFADDRVLRYKIQRIDLENVQLIKIR